MKLKFRFSCFFMVGLLLFMIYMGLFIGLLLEYAFPVLGLNNSGEDLVSFFIVLFLPFISGGVFLGLYFVNPMLFMMSLIAKLSAGIYDLTEADKRLYTKKGKLKKRYSLYREVVTDLYNLALSLEQAEAQRKKLEEAKENWIRGISHDLKTPLSYIVGYSALLTNSSYHWNQEEIQSFYSEIYTKGKYMEDLISDLRISLNSENTKVEVPLSPVMFDLIPFLQTVIADIANMPGAENYELDFQTPVDTFLIMADKKLLYRAFQNLLINAVYHNPVHTQISIRVINPQEKLVSIGFCDNGIGLNEKVIKNFSDSKIVSNQSHGLEIVKSIIEAHNGTIIVESKPNQGSQFYIELSTNY
jgi:signal transduction histidine kinase